MPIRPAAVASAASVVEKPRPNPLNQIATSRIIPQKSTAAPAAEQTLWHGSPSWLLLLGKLIWLAVALIVVPAVLVWANNRFLPDPNVMRIVWIVVAAAIVWRAVGVAIAFVRIRSTLYT